MSALHGINADFFLPEIQTPPAQNPQEQRLQGLTLWPRQEGLLRKPPHSEGIITSEILSARTLLLASQHMIVEDIDRLKRSYGFPQDDSVTVFLAHHRALPVVLLSAVPHLREAFGPEGIFNLEVSTDDDGSQTLYAVAVWHDTVQTAAAALERFEESWWLDHMVANTADLAFTYELA